MDSVDNQSKRLTFWTFLQLYVRSFFIQGSFSTKYRQNVGFAFCIEPVCKQLWNDPESRKSFLLRHLEDYNGNPFMITLVLGAVAKLEEMYRHRKGVTAQDISQFKKAVGPATGSLGDRFFWGTLRPFGIILGLFITLFYGVWGVIMFLLAYNIPTLALRWHWLNAGYRLGAGVVSEIQNKKIDTTIRIIGNLSAATLAFMTVIHITFFESTVSWVTGATVSVFIVSFFLLRRSLSLANVFLICIAITAVLALIAQITM